MQYHIPHESGIGFSYAELKPQEMSSCSWKAKIIMASVTPLPLKITHKASLDQVTIIAYLLYEIYPFLGRNI